MATIEILVDIQTHDTVNGDAEELGEQFAEAINNLVMTDNSNGFPSWISEIDTTVEVTED